ncbi:hypothetical protein [Saccharopolyspora griseoalba]|uniref:Uncharacterized protein n=1 Tax=Saccharopolyspora griseoalba TaxID=1431848 RepID=A0ABW2LUR4_9PSEU
MQESEQALPRLEDALAKAEFVPANPQGAETKPALLVGSVLVLVGFEHDDEGKLHMAVSIDIDESPDSPVDDLLVTAEGTVPLIVECNGKPLVKLP